MTTVDVVGGGIAGLTAAIACAEAGADVVVREAHESLGGRGRATAPPYVAHDGGHVFYAGGADHEWLRRHGFVNDLGWPSIRDLTRVGFRVDGTLRRVPPMTMVRAQSQRWLTAPVDADLHSWASARWSAATARHIANATAVVTYHADTGGLSAAFVWRLFQRVFGPRLPTVRWVRGGWQHVIDQMCDRADHLGVRIETGSRVSALSGGPTIVATDIHSAARLLQDDSLTGTSGHCVLLDVAVDRRRTDTTIAFDLDEGGFGESYSMHDPSVAADGEALYQFQMPVRSGETLGATRKRLRDFADTVVPDWANRATFTREGSAKGRTGALDRPGRSWTDRPSVDRGGGVYVVGDMMAAPGMRGEIAINSALVATKCVTESLGLG